MSGASKELKEAGVLTLREYIDKYHQGYQFDFAIHYGFAEQQVSRWMKMDVLMINGTMYIASSVNKNVDFLEDKP